MLHEFGNSLVEAIIFLGDKAPEIASVVRRGHDMLRSMGRPEIHVPHAPSYAGLSVAGFTFVKARIASIEVFRV